MGCITHSSGFDTGLFLVGCITRSSGLDSIPGFFCGLHNALIWVMEYKRTDLYWATVMIMRNTKSSFLYEQLFGFGGWVWEPSLTHTSKLHKRSARVTNTYDKQIAHDPPCPCLLGGISRFLSLASPDHAGFHQSSILLKWTVRMCRVSSSVEYTSSLVGRFFMV